MKTMFFFILFVLSTTSWSGCLWFSVDGACSDNNEIWGVRSGHRILYPGKISEYIPHQIKFDTQDILYIDSLENGAWIETEKNRELVFCSSEKGEWFASFEKKMKVDGNCIHVAVPKETGTFFIQFKPRFLSQKKKINVAVGMKLVDFRDRAVKIGFNDGDYVVETQRINNQGAYEKKYLNEEKIVHLNEMILVDQYLVSECDFIEVLGDSISSEVNARRKHIEDYFVGWVKKKKQYGGVCDNHDSAAINISLYHALLYANMRSVREGLSPVYHIEKIHAKPTFLSKLYENGDFDVYATSFYDSFVEINGWNRVHVDKNANGYRLPYYNEWLALARGGMLSGENYWANIAKASEYAWLGERKHVSRPVGVLEPNGFSLYDMLGLVCELTLLNEGSYYNDEFAICAGGNITDSVENIDFGAKELHKMGSTGGGYNQGLRLVRTLK